VIRASGTPRPGSRLLTPLVARIVRDRAGRPLLARRPVRLGIAAGVLLSSLATGLVIVTTGSGGGVGNTAPVAAQDAAGTVPGVGRIAFAGTGHLSLGVVTGTASSSPLFGDGPVHFDQDAYARGEQMAFTSLRDSPKPQIYLRAADGAVSKLTTDMDGADPELTPDGRSVVFDAAEPGGPGGATQRDLWIVGTDGTGLRRLTDTPADETSPTVSPDGTEVAYASTAFGAHRQIAEQPLRGGAATQITHATDGDATDPEWNPVDDAAHADLIAYTLDAGGATGPRLHLTTPGGTDQPLLSGDQADQQTSAVAWLPDGDGFLFLSKPCDCTTAFASVFRAQRGSAAAPLLVYQENRDVTAPTWLGTEENGQVVVTRTSGSAVNAADLEDVLPDGSDPRDLGLSILTEDPAAGTNTDPSKDPLFTPAAGFDPWTERQTYTPDGSQIVVTRFEDSPAGRIERIWLVNADGSDPHPMNLAGRGPDDWDTDPALSPDGTLIAFTRSSPGGVGSAAGPSRILIANVATGAIVGTVEPPAGQQATDDAQPTWSSDGTELAFTRTLSIGGNGANKHVWTVSVNDLAQQTDLSAKDCPGDCEVIDDSPAFSPDGTTVAFNRKDGDGRTNEDDGVLVMSASGADCRVILPLGLGDDPDSCTRPLPDTTQTGPFQPRDVAWSPDASQLVLTSRRAVAANSPEGLQLYDFATQKLTAVDAGLPGRQKEPSFQQTVDLALTAPPASAPVTTGSRTTVTTTVTDHGSAAAPGTTFTVAVPPGATLDGLTSPAGSCDAASLTCSLGTVRPGASVQVTATVTGTVVGDQPFDWSVTSAVLDADPGDNTARTVVPVQAATPPSSPPPSVTPPPAAPPAAPPPPKAGPALTIKAQPNPGFVGGHVTVTYTIRNGASARASGLTLGLGLPAKIPAKLPAGCSAGTCTLSDLAPGGKEVVQVVLSPKAASKNTLTGRLTTTGTDANPRDNTARTTLRILQPRIVAVPPIGRPGFVTSVRGKDFPPGAPVTLTWKPGITAAAAPTIPGRDGTFAGQLLILTKDQTGPRTITARGPGFGKVTTPFLVVSGTVQPPDEVERR
jgi:Tol biopolymer transport system component